MNAFGASHRFTPAYAGNTLLPSVESVIDEVHPRIRGEYSAQVSAACAEWGSPPHTRGIPSQAVKVTAPKGFTPAYAGNTYPETKKATELKVHPRIRGEY